MKTPYKRVARSADADSEVVCTLSVAGKTADGDERLLSAKWIDRKGATIRPSLSLPLPNSPDERTIERAAGQVTNMMEAPW
jgi:hypothetical protein